MPSDESIVKRWKAKLAVDRYWLRRARASVVYWGSRAGSARGLRMLKEARLRYRARELEIAADERVIERHSGISTVSANGLALVASFEGFRSCPYRDAVGVWTIGYGETQGVGPGTKCWSRAYALQRLRVRINRDYLQPVLRVAKSIGLHLSQNEADALASLVYNLGPGILGHDKTMGSALRSRDRKRIADAFLVYDKAGGRTLLGLTRRRAAERRLFLR